MEDIHAGMGGSYVINDAGEKVLMHRTDHVPAAPAPTPAFAAKKNKAQPDNKTGE